MSNPYDILSGSAEVYDPIVFIINGSGAGVGMLVLFFMVTVATIINTGLRDK